MRSNTLGGAILVFVCTVSMSPSLVGAASDSLDPALPTFQRTEGLAGRIASVGSDTLADLMKKWGRELLRQHLGKVSFSSRARGSSTAPPALIAGKSNVGPMSRPMKPAEVKAFHDKFGYDPTPIRVAIDALAVYVNADNPLKGLSFPQLSAIFSPDRRCGYPKDITLWGQVGLSGRWAKESIALVGRNSRSGTYGYFRKHALCAGSYKTGVEQEPGNSALVQIIAMNNNAMGYAGFAYRRISRLRPLALAKTEGGALVTPTAKTAISGEYPLSRALYVYIDKPPGKPVDPAVAEFLRLALSKKGQKIVAKTGYIPLTAEMAEIELRKIR